MYAPALIAIGILSIPFGVALLLYRFKLIRRDNAIMAIVALLLLAAVFGWPIAAYALASSTR